MAHGWLLARHEQSVGSQPIRAHEFAGMSLQRLGGRIEVARVRSGSGRQTVALARIEVVKLAGRSDHRSLASKGDGLCLSTPCYQPGLAGASPIARRPGSCVGVGSLLVLRADDPPAVESIGGSEMRGSRRGFASSCGCNPRPRYDRTSATYSSMVAQMGINARTTSNSSRPARRSSCRRTSCDRILASRPSISATATNSGARQRWRSVARSCVAWCNTARRIAACSCQFLTTASTTSPTVLVSPSGQPGRGPSPTAAAPTPPAHPPTPRAQTPAPQEPAPLQSSAWPDRKAQGQPT